MRRRDSIRPANKPVVLRLTDGIRFAAGPDHWTLDPLEVIEGEAIALAPGGEEPVVDPAGQLGRILVTMAEPIQGHVELFGDDVYRMDYSDRQRMRARVGFVHGYGGLLSARTIRENVALPVAIHGKLSAEAEARHVSSILQEFGLGSVADKRPHDMDGATRWRACLARSVILEPQWLVLEGLGNWEMDGGRGTGWSRLMARLQNGMTACVICLPRENPGFEGWFADHGGQIVRYNRSSRETILRLGL